MTAFLYVSYRFKCFTFSIQNSFVLKFERKSNQTCFVFNEVKCVVV